MKQLLLTTTLLLGCLMPSAAALPSEGTGEGSQLSTSQHLTPSPHPSGGAGGGSSLSLLPRDSIRLSDPCVFPDYATHTYYMTGTGGMLWKSRDLNTWTGPYRVAETDPRSWMGPRPQIWAAEIHQYKGKYYYFATFTNNAVKIDSVRGNVIPRRASHVLVSDRAEGPYRPMQDSIYLNPRQPTLDGTFWVEPDGTPYMVYCGEWLQNWNGTMECIQLKPDLSGTVGQPTVLFRAKDAPWSHEVEDGIEGPNKVTDGPYLFRTATGRLGMIWTSWRDDVYTQGVAYSESGTIFGPWAHEPEPITPPNYGHGMLFMTFDGQWLLSAHSHDNSTGRYVRVPCLFEADLSGDKLRIGRRLSTVEPSPQTFDKFLPVSEDQEQMAVGQYEPTWQSLSNYQTPEWFRDAKFGIWAHWGPQCVEGSGDWMARNMYHEGSREYLFHRDHYGHQSEVGFKDILPLFRAEHWQPDSLVAYYKQVGARYFFALGNHHDNFDLWDSQYQPWNSVRIGPKRDILAEWAAAAGKAGLPLGISFHADHAWRWYEPAQKCDSTGPYKGVPYDGNLTRADGKGKWWDGLDPQDLYAQQHPLSTGSIHNQWDWTHGAVLPSQQFVDNFYNRTLDAINRYHPSLIYFDVTVLPFYGLSDCGLRIAAHEYNKGENVVFGKILQEHQRKALTWDVERGAPNAIQPYPWQTCTCLGGWHWNNDISRHNHYKQAPQVVRFLADVVSKNGNLLLSVPLRPDGTFDEHEHAILEGIRAWLDQNGEAIYATRPWVRFGEGPLADSDIKINAQGFNEGSYAQMGSEEIRFTQTQQALYAIVMGWPDSREVVIRSLCKGNPDFKKRIKHVHLLGYGRLKARQTADALIVSLPTQPVNAIAPVLRIGK